MTQPTNPPPAPTASRTLMLLTQSFVDDANYGGMLVQAKRYTEAYSLLTGTLASVKATFQVLEETPGGGTDSMPVAAPCAGHPAVPSCTDRDTLHLSEGNVASHPPMNYSLPQAEPSIGTHLELTHRSNHSVSLPPSLPQLSQSSYSSYSSPSDPQLRLIVGDPLFLQWSTTAHSKSSSSLTSSASASSTSASSTESPFNILTKVSIAIMFNLALQHHLQALSPLPVSGEDPNGQQHQAQQQWRYSMLSSAANLYKTSFQFIQQELLLPHWNCRSDRSSFSTLLTRQSERCIHSLIGITWNNLACVHLSFGDVVTGESYLERLLLHLSLPDANQSASTAAADAGASMGTAGAAADNTAMVGSTDDATMMMVTGDEADHSATTARSEPEQGDDGVPEMIGNNNNSNITSNSTSSRMATDDSSGMHDTFWSNITLLLWRHGLAAGSA